MDDQLELHLQRFLEEESESGPNEEADDLQQLLTLQSSSTAASSTNKQASDAIKKDLGESSSLEEPQQSQDTQSESVTPEHYFLEHHMLEFPPTTAVTDRFLRITQFLESQLETPNSFTGVFIKLLWVLPIIVVLGEHVGWIWSLQWAILGIVILHFKPDHFLMPGKVENDGHNNKVTVAAKSEHALKTTNGTTNAVGQAQRPKEEHKLMEKTITKVSHLLGLAGAPPPLWPLKVDQSSKMDDEGSVVDAETNKNVAQEPKSNNNQSNDQQHDSKEETDVSPAALSSLLVHFVESQVQFLLTVDQALDYLRISASIHLGLGPQSQCVERVEQAAVARNIRYQKRRKQQQQQQQPQTNNDTTGTSEEEDDDDDSKLPIATTKKTRSLEPQRGTNKSVLSLVSLRRNLAKSMVRHSETLDAFWKLVYEQHQERDPNSEDGQSYLLEGRDPLLEMPHIVNLAWIKDARRILAESLSGTVEELLLLLLEGSSSSPEGNQTTPEPWRVRLGLEDADAQSRQLTQYLRGALLLPFDTVGEIEASTTMVHAVDDPNDPLFKSLMNFRTQLDALGTALWSCQQYCSDQQSTAAVDNVPNEELELAEDPTFLRRQWWLKIRQMSETCRAFETEITEIYFPQEASGEESGAESDDANDNTQPVVSQETGDYVHGDGKTRDVEGTARKEKTTKTVVFSGKGKVEDRPKTSGRKGKGSNGMDSDVVVSGSVMPQRDTVSELAMVSELQNRIKALNVDEEIEEVESDSEEQKAARLARQPTVPLFLGASGSLLSELKQSIPSIGLLNSEIGNVSGEEIIGED